MNSVFRGHQTVARPVREATAASDCLAASVLVPMRTDCRCNDESGRRVDAYTLSLVFFFFFFHVGSYLVGGALLVHVIDRGIRSGRFLHFFG